MLPIQKCPLIYFSNMKYILSILFVSELLMVKFEQSIKNIKIVLESLADV